MKIHILFKFKDRPFGGGNQFLKSLKKNLHLINAYEEDLVKADAVLFNSHHCIEDVAKCKRKHPDKLFVHRIDGPMRLYNKIGDKRDDIVLVANKWLADATIFQSEWSRGQNYRLGLPGKRFEATISNAPDAAIFNRKGKNSFSIKRKIRLIASSWSLNWKKGFCVYKWLDDNLDFDRYEMFFVGRRPIEFKKIEAIPPLSSEELAEQLKRCDIFIAASQKDPCSNSLIEALHCGLPAIGLSDGGHPEIIAKGGETFSKPQDIPALLEKITENYAEYQANICSLSIKEVAGKYYDFVSGVRRQISFDPQGTRILRRVNALRSRVWISLGRTSGYIQRNMAKLRVSDKAGLVDSDI